MGASMGAAVVTGGGSGIGRCVVEKLLEEPDRRVVVVDVSAPDREVWRGDSERVRWLVGDVADRSQVENNFDQAVKWAGHVDRLVTCAGRHDRASAYDMTVEQWASTIHRCPYMSSDVVKRPVTRRSPDSPPGRDGRPHGRRISSDTG